MAAKKTIALLAFVAPFLVACGGNNCSVLSSVAEVSYNLTFHQTEEGPIEDKTITVTVGKTRIEQVWGQEPEINEKVGYTSVWEDYTIDDKTADFSVEPVYTPIEYVATFINRVTGNVLGTQKYTMLTTELDLPELPTDFGYTYEWESYVITVGGMNVYCDRTANIHTARFYEDAAKTVQVGEDVKFSIESESIPEPEVPTHEGYDGHWGEYSLKLDQDIDIVAEYELHGFYVQFAAEGNNIGDPVYYNVEMTYDDIEKPEIPAKTGYTGAWPSEVTLQFAEKDDPQVIEAIYTAKTYTITYVGTDGETVIGTSTATYDAEYTLNAAPENYAWYVDGKKVATSGTWTTDDDLTVYAKSKYLHVDFEDGGDTDLLVMTGTSAPRIVEDEYLGKCLEVTLSGALGRATPKAGVLDTMFADPSVVEVRFDARGSWITNDFRHSLNGNNVCYETNQNEFGLSNQWKTFAFTRAMYEEAKTGSNFYMIYAAGGSAGATLRLDNFRVATESLTSYGFENGRLVGNTNSGYEHRISFRHFDYNFDPKHNELFVTNTDTNFITSYGFDYTNKTEGNRSIKLTKEDGYISFTVVGAQSMLDDGNKVMKVDIYSSVYANIEAGNFKDGMNNNSFGAKGHPANQWVTYTFTKSMITNDGRFLILLGSTAGDWYFDNIRFVPAE